MSDDLLKRATQALRETSDEPNLRSGLTRARLLESAERKATARRGSSVRWVLAMAGVLVAGTALARVADQLPALVEAIAPWAAPERPEPRPKERTKAPPPHQTVHVPAPLPDAQPAQRTSGPRKPRSQPRTNAIAIAEAPAPAPPSSGTPEPQAESAELALFRRAQQLHLARDPQALAAWDAYLHVAAHGALVPEARYNRALCLMRLLRTDEARAALAPFARGVYGAYRQAEAQQLLDALAR